MDWNKQKNKYALLLKTGDAELRAAKYFSDLKDIFPIIELTRGRKSKNDKDVYKRQWYYRYPPHGSDCLSIGHSHRHSRRYLSVRKAENLVFYSDPFPYRFGTRQSFYRHRYHCLFLDCQAFRKLFRSGWQYCPLHYDEMCIRDSNMSQAARIQSILRDT